MRSFSLDNTSKITNYLDEERIMLGNLGFVEIWVTHPVWLRSFPFSINVSVAMF